MRTKIGLLVATFVLAFGAPTYAQIVWVNEDFSGGTDPLSYLYQDPAVSTDSFAFSDPNDNMSGEARRGRNAPVEWVNGTAERAYVSFDATGYGDGDQYLEYTEDFDFSFDVNFSSFVAAANDERLMLGLWYSPTEAEADNATHYKRWANRQHMVGAVVEEDGTQVRFYIFFGNGGDWAGKTASDDLTGTASLSTGVNYRIEGHYRYDGSTYGQIYGRLIDLDSATVVGEVTQEVITQDADIYSVAYCNFNGDIGNRRFLIHSTMGVGNETWGSTQQPGPQFTSDNWYLGIPEPSTLAMLMVGMGALAFGLCRRKR